jgi:hypothetical protein
MISGGKVIEQCVWCGKYVTVNKRFLGSLHLCLTDEEKAIVQQPPLQDTSPDVVRFLRQLNNCKGKK